MLRPSETPPPSPSTVQKSERGQGGSVSPGQRPLPRSVDPGWSATESAPESLPLESLNSKRQGESLVDEGIESGPSQPARGPARQLSAEELGEGDWATRSTSGRLKSGSYPPTNLETFQLAKVK